MISTLYRVRLTLVEEAVPHEEDTLSVTQHGQPGYGWRFDPVGLRARRHPSPTAAPPSRRGYHGADRSEPKGVIAV
jgi:hypothetical protein